MTFPPKVSGFNRVNGQAFSKVFMAKPEHMTRAIDAAYAVKDVWGNTTPAERELILIRAADVLESMRAEVVDLLIEEAVSTFGKSQFEVSYVVGVLRFLAPLMEGVVVVCPFYVLSPEGECKCLHPAIEELDFEGAIFDHSLLPEELIEAMVAHGAISLGVTVDPVVFTRHFAV